MKKRRNLLLFCIGLLLFNCVLGPGLVRAENNFTQVVNPGESWKFVNTDIVSQSITTDASNLNGRVFDYIIYYSNNANGISGWNSEVGLITVPAGGSIVVTCTGINPVSFGGLYPYITGQSSSDPALLKQTVSAGQSWKLVNTDSVSRSITTDASILNGRIFDYVIYYSNGTTNKTAWNTGATLLTIPAGGNIVVTCTGINPVTFGGAYPYITGESSPNPALWEQIVKPGETWKFVNTTASSQSVMTDASTSNGRIFDYVIYLSDGTPYTTVSNSGTTSIIVPDGGNIVAAGTGINPVTFAGAYPYFTISAINIPAPIDIPIMSGLPSDAIIEQGSIYALSGTINANALTNVTLKVAGYTGGDIYSQALAGVSSFDLGNITIDTNHPAFAAPGIYTVEVWAATPSYNPIEPLGQMTLNIISVPDSGNLIEARSQYYSLSGDTLEVGAVLTQMIPQTYQLQLGVRAVHSADWMFYNISNYNEGAFVQTFSAAALGMIPGRYELKLRIIENDQIVDQTKKTIIKIPEPAMTVNMLMNSLKKPHGKTLF